MNALLVAMTMLDDMLACHDPVLSDEDREIYEAAEAEIAEQLSVFGIALSTNYRMPLAMIAVRAFNKGQHTPRNLDAEVIARVQGAMEEPDIESYRGRGVEVVTLFLSDVKAMLEALT